MKKILVVVLTLMSASAFASWRTQPLDLNTTCVLQKQNIDNALTVNIYNTLNQGEYVMEVIRTTIAGTKTTNHEAVQFSAKCGFSTKCMGAPTTYNTKDGKYSLKITLAPADRNNHRNGQFIDLQNDNTEDVLCKVIEHNY